jgi:prevent-host-death family protein
MPARLVRIAASDAREQLAELVNEVAYGGLRVILQRHGRDRAAVVSLDDLRKLGVRVPADPMRASVRPGRGRRGGEA